MYPQFEQVFVLGYHLSATMSALLLKFEINIIKRICTQTVDTDGLGLKPSNNTIHHNHIQSQLFKQIMVQST